METVLATLRSEFADIGDPAGMTIVATRLLLAVGLAAVMGYERERRHSAAGLRTHMLIALGVALVVIAAERSQLAAADVSRVLQGVLAGIGFLGAGAILKQKDTEHIRGLTTAASIWATAAIAMAAGLGREVMAIAATVLALVILTVVLRFERRTPPALQEKDESQDRSDP